MNKINYALLALIFCNLSFVQADPSTFKTQILSKPVIEHPDDPFITIFVQGGVDGNRYGFRTKGNLTQQDWVDVLSNVGYLAPYTIADAPNILQCHVANADLSTCNLGRDLPVFAAQSIGRQTAGSVNGNSISDTDIPYLHEVYVTPEWLNMDHFFFDIEDDLGTPGGLGEYRLRMDHSITGAMRATNHDDFNTGLGGALESFEIDFGFYMHNFVFGGSSVLFGSRTDGFQSGGKGWYVKVANIGGFFGQTYIVFSSDGNDQVYSLPIDRTQGMLFHNVNIRVDPANEPNNVAVTISIDGVGTTASVDVRRPTVTNTGFFIEAPLLLNDKSTEYDDIKITSHSGALPVTIAHYTFETEGGIAVTEGPVSVAQDVSGRGHDLSVDIVSDRFEYVPVHGVDSLTLARLKTVLVDDLKVLRAANGAEPPALLTNWRVSGKPGRFAFWNTQGISHGSATYYMEGDVATGLSNLSTILDTQKTLWAWEDGTDWQHIWWGAYDPDNVSGDGRTQAVMTAEQHQSALSLAILEGNRWVSVFTSMSNGTLANAAADDTEMATVNADVYYALAQTADWFQGTSPGLKTSVYVENISGLPAAAAPYSRARHNLATNEYWFAGFVPEGKMRVQIDLPAQKGELINLATGATKKVNRGSASLTLKQSAQPYYFQPSSQ